MKILVVGSGGREHAICWALQRTSSERLQLFCAPGNAGIAQIAECVPIKINDCAALASFAEASKIDLTMVGPEAPLAAGLVDTFEDRGLKVVGPRIEAARLESSKAFAKDFMDRHSIPTARYRVTTSLDEGEAILNSGEFGDQNASVVIKADGLAAGKGVFIASDRRQAFAASQRQRDRHLLLGTRLTGFRQNGSAVGRARLFRKRNERGLERVDLQPPSYASRQARC